MKPWLPWVYLLAGMAFGLGASLLLIPSPPATPAADPRAVGLPWGWLIFGFLAQGVFMARMIVQWVASERARASVVPQAFWWLSLIGGVMLLVYFLRRGDPVGVWGQLLGVVVYVRNLALMRRAATTGKAD